MENNKINDTLSFLKRAGKLKDTPRYSANLKYGGDSVAEHSWQLSLMVFVIANQGKLPINLEKALGFALIHDLVEAKTGDLDGFKVSTRQPALKEKILAEQEAMHDLTDDLAMGGWIYDLWEEYERQDCLESKLVKALDKIEAYLHVAETTIETYIPMNLPPDYAEQAGKAFDGAAYIFPELNQLMTEMKLDMQDKILTRGLDLSSIT